MKDYFKDARKHIRWLEKRIKQYEESELEWEEKFKECRFREGVMGAAIVHKQNITLLEIEKLVQSRDDWKNPH